MKGRFQTPQNRWFETLWNAAAKTIDVCTTDAFTDNYRERRQYVQTGYYAAIGNYWTYGDRWPGYYFGYNAGKVGQILSFDDEVTYGVHVFTERQGHSPRFWPAKEGYELFADLNENELMLHPTAIGREKGDGYMRMLPPKWCTRIPVRGKAMVLAGERLYVAGPPDEVPEDDPMGSFEGRLGGRLWVISASDGERLAEYELNQSPVFDGLIAAQGRLYISGQGGVLTCMGEKL